MNKMRNLSLIIALTLIAITGSSQAMRRTQSFRLPTGARPAAQPGSVTHYTPSAGTLFTADPALRMPSPQTRAKAATDIQRVWRGKQTRMPLESMTQAFMKDVPEHRRRISRTHLTGAMRKYHQLPPSEQRIIRTIASLKKRPLYFNEPSHTPQYLAYGPIEDIKYTITAPLSRMTPSQQKAFIQTGGVPEHTPQTTHFSRYIPRGILDLRTITTDPTSPATIAALRAGLPTNFERKNYQALFDALPPENQAQVSAAIRHPAQLAPAMRMIDLFHGQGARAPGGTIASFADPATLRSISQVSTTGVNPFWFGSKQPLALPAPPVQ